MSDDEKKNLIEVTNRLIATNQKLGSLKYNFFRGIIFGIGSAIGASVIAAIVFGLASKFFQALKNFSL
ncbi:MAG: hypothetical protein ACD_9C00173G0001 [uncultured bacterium]|nr:MAG: hypothetical protein ACD_9C00173G0001 [uncultured bacterium]